MAAEGTPLPEGTDHIINGASGGTATGLDAETERLEAGKDGSGGAPGSDGFDASGTRGAFFEKFEEVKSQGFDRAREYAVMGKDRATGALDDLLKMINDAAAQVDDKVGSQYGDYARRAADGLGTFNDALKGKDVDELFRDARELVAKAPAVAVGTAAALGFIVARLAKAGLDSDAKSKDASAG